MLPDQGVKLSVCSTHFAFFEENHVYLTYIVYILLASDKSSTT